MARSDWPIVVGGCHRTGTSLLRRVLDAHPRIHCGPEVPFFRDFYGDYFEDPLAHLRFNTTARALLPEDELLELLGAGFVGVHRRAADRAAKPRWADKAPENVIHTAGWERLLGQDWLFVHVVRNPLDTLASMEERGFPLTLPLDLDGRIDLYRRYTEAGLEFAERNPGRCYRLVYEELCLSPQASVEALMAWLGEAFDAEQMAFNDTAHQRGLEDPKVVDTRVVHGDSIGRWPSHISEAEAARIWSKTRDLWERVDPEVRHVPSLPHGAH